MTIKYHGSVKSKKQVNLFFIFYLEKILIITIKGIFTERIRAHTTDKSSEQFLVSQLNDIQTDKLIEEAVKLIYQSIGTIHIKELNEKLFICQSLFEKRFRKVVGTTAKKFASIVRFHAVHGHLSDAKMLTEICCEYNFFDQEHFKSGADFPFYIKEIKDLGVTHYEAYVTEGHIDCHGANDYTAIVPAKFEPLVISDTSSRGI